MHGLLFKLKPDSLPGETLETFIGCDSAIVSTCHDNAGAVRQAPVSGASGEITKMSEGKTFRVV